MSFQSASYGLFLAFALCVFWLLSGRRNTRTLFLLIASYWFYAAWETWHLSLIVFSTFLDYFCGNRIHAAASRAAKRPYLILSLAGNLGLLGFFKYTNWGIDNLNAVMSGFGVTEPIPALDMLLPIGISFYTFQSLSYTLDIYFGYLKPARNFLDFATFVAFFPQLVAGPIVRARTFLPQLEQAPRVDRAQFADGFWRIGIGLVKKVAIADTIGRLIVDPVYGNPELWSTPVRLLALLGFTFQIYYDFSAYTDIAIGSAKLFGFELPENFNRPFLSRSVSEFWRRWHMTVGAWVRDYLVAPLLGRRHKRTEARLARSLIISMVVIGVWHGAGWLWVLYGLSQGVVMVVERALSLRRARAGFATTRGRSLLVWSATFLFIVAVSGLCIRCTDWSHLVRMLTPGGEASALPAWGLVALASGITLHFTPVALRESLRTGAARLPVPVAGVVFGLVVGGVAFLSVGESPFIYFRF